ncbi:MAG: endonuclease/exonuclease/phosphatase family protein [Pirellulales bacterium]
MRDSTSARDASPAADTSGPKPFPWLLLGWALPLLAATLGGFCGDWHWLLDLMSHFRWYYLLAAAVGLVVAIVRNAGIATRTALAAALAVNAWTMLPYWLPASQPAAPAAGTTVGPVSVISLNVLRSNQDTAPTIDYLRRRSADVVAVLEVSPEWDQALDTLADIYPHRRIEPRLDNFGIALLSRWPLIEPQIVDFGDTGYPSIVADVDRPAGRFHCIAIHPYPPYSRSSSGMLVRHLHAVGAAAARSPLPCIVAGDFNATPWSAGFRAFLAGSGLRDTALGLGVQPSWNARSPFVRIPIDHIFAPLTATVIRRTIGPDVGSDHFPVEAELRLPSGQVTP